MAIARDLQQVLHTGITASDLRLRFYPARWCVRHPFFCFALSLWRLPPPSQSHALHQQLSHQAISRNHIHALYQRLSQWTIFRGMPHISHPVPSAFFFWLTSRSLRSRRTLCFPLRHWPSARGPPVDSGKLRGKASPSLLWGRAGEGHVFPSQLMEGEQGSRVTPFRTLSLISCTM